MSDFSQFPALERLILAGCLRLIDVCESIEHCIKLVLLDLSYCNQLKRLPKNIKKLKNVKILSIHGCARFDEFPREIKDMESLQVLNASDININSQSSLCAVVEVIPRRVKSISLLFPSSLVSLSLRNNNLCNNSFPMDLSSLSKLKVLNLSMNPITSLPDFVRSLDALEFLCLEGCHSLKSAYCLPSTVNFLDANNCTSLETITFDKKLSSFAPPMVNFLSSKSLTEIEGMRKIQPLAEVDEEILRSLGWNELEVVKNQQVYISDGIKFDTLVKLPVQMLYEFGIFSTFYECKELPNWITHKSNGGSISFTIPSSSVKVIGLNVGYTSAYIPHSVDWLNVVRNHTSKRVWVYEVNVQAVRDSVGEESVIYLRHWMTDELQAGDEVTVSVSPGYLPVSECGISLVYDNQNNDKDPLAYYKSWKHVIGGDLSCYESSERCKYFKCDVQYYMLNRHHTSPTPDAFQDVTTHAFVRYIPPQKQYIDHMI